MTMKIFCFYSFCLLMSVFCFGQNNAVTLNIVVLNNKTNFLYVKDKNEIIRQIKFSKSNYFSDYFQIREGIYQINYDKSYSDVYLKPGFNLKITVDANNFEETIKYSGKGEAENNYIIQQNLDDNKTFDEEIYNLDSETFEKLLIENGDSKLIYLEKQNFDPEFIILQKRKIEMSILKLREMYTQHKLMTK